jgi:3-oxoacid CoA-transferase B subunit
MVGVGPLAKEGEEHPDLINAGRQSITETPGCVYVDCSEAFGMLRGGHLGAAVLGAFEVDGEGTVSNWIIPGGTLLGVGGAMDLVCGAETLIVAMTQTNGDEPKLVKECKLPVTGYHEVDYVVTEICVLHFVDNKPILEKLHPSTTVEEVRALVEFEFAVADEVEAMVV